jgi:Na+-transporting NADH:ubiquinone oxidoreductase subunit F
MSVILSEQFLNVKEWIARVVSNTNVASFIKELVVELEPDEEINYKPGGFLEVYIPPFVTNTDEWDIPPKYRSEWEKYAMIGKRLDFSSHEEQKRAYSLASYPDEKEKLMFNVRIASPPLKEGKVSDEIPWGFGSSYLFSLKAGDTIRVAGPFGQSFMIDDERDLYFLIGGAGSSFCRSHVFNLFRRQKTNRKVSMWYGARSLKENIYQRDSEELETIYPNFSYHLVLSEPTKEDIEGGWPEKDPLKTNFLFKAFEMVELQKLDEPEEALYYVCGPPLHNKSVMKMLDDYGVPKDNIIIDDFGN